ncbi:MAG: transglycosylase SLT domain-containing protein [Treponemataceae bacterium]|nr:transglycosylase SLT domain-containing protein [Treponemataceae bacterium]
MLLCIFLFEPVFPGQQSAEAPSYQFIDIDYPDHDLIEKFRNEYMSGFGLKRLQEILEKAAPYRPYIRRRLEEEGMPICLEFLPIIESNFNTEATSKSGAAGLWQFMENSIRGYLIKDEWIDERKDPWLSTEAAISKLKDNYKYFNDWALALAAYNMGLGGLSKVIRNTGTDSAWNLIDGGHLKTETTNYVPKFIAIADIVTNAEYYGITLPEYDEKKELRFSMIKLDEQINLEQLSLLSGINIEELKLLNPALIYPVTPYGRQFSLRIPEGTEEEAARAIAKLSGLQATIYTVEKGDTLWAISRKYGLTVQELCDTNNISERDILHIGTKLFVPIYK